jgi:uncharacterized protein YdhG (YjbR/CyaY superfamily)
MKARKAAASVDEYIDGFGGDVKARLVALREAIQAAAPEAEERLSYGMPAYFQGGALVYFGAFKHHIGLFPTSQGTAAFPTELAGFQTSKGTVQLPHDEPLPLDLVQKIVAKRLEQNAAKAKPTKAKPAKPAKTKPAKTKPAVKRAKATKPAKQRGRP